MEYRKKENKTIAKIKLVCGFTLIETMVAITILLTAIIGPMEIASKALFSSFYARDQIIAYYLAQEGVEYLRHDRDTYYLQNPSATDWPSTTDNKFSDCVSDNNITTFGCEVDVKNQKIVKYNESSDITPLMYDSNSGLYSYDTITSKPSKYSRVVIVSPDANPDEIDVTSTIFWSGSYLPGTKKSFTIKESLYKWQTK